MIRVLLVDDHEAIREGLRTLIDQEPDMTVVADIADGAAAVEQATGTQADVVVLDVTMAGLGGLSTAIRLKERTASAIVIFTRHNDDACVRDLMAAGALGYVLKQSPTSELVAAIRAAAAGNPYLDRSLPRRGDGRDVHVTDREADVLRKAALGLSNKEIAAALHISAKTVEVHKSHAMRKLNLRGRADIIRYALLHDWLREP